MSAATETSASTYVLVHADDPAVARAAAIAARLAADRVVDQARTFPAGTGRQTPHAARWRHHAIARQDSGQVPTAPTAGP